MGRTNNVDKKNERPKKGSGTKAAGSAVNAKAEENGGEAAQKPVEVKKSAAEKAAERAAKKEKKEKEEARGARKALRNAVKKVVKAKCGSIAQKLIEETERGNMRSASIVISLMEKKKDKNGKNDDGPSEAELLGSEEQWKDESPLATEATSEVGEGGRETENAGT